MQTLLNQKLHEAAKKGSITEVLSLLKEGADVNANNGAALAWAAYNGHLRLAKMLLKAGADKNLVNSNKTPEDYARERNHSAVESLLQDWQESPDEVSLKRPLSDRTLEEVFNFVSLERISLVRNGPHGAVEAITRESFGNLADTSTLKKAFEIHVRRGGKADESAVFPRTLGKSSPRLPHL